MSARLLCAESKRNARREKFGAPSLVSGERLVSCWSPEASPQIPLITIFPERILRGTFQLAADAIVFHGFAMEPQAPITPEENIRGEIVSSRHFSVTPDRLFAAFSDPAKLARWWGPKGFTNDIKIFELRPCGAWRFTMIGPDQQRYEIDKTFVDVEPGSRILVRHHGPVHGFHMTMLYTAENGGTRLTWRMQFDDADHAEQIRDFIASANEENFDRLEALLNEG